MSKRTKTSVGEEVIILDSSASSSEDEGSIENHRHGHQAVNKAACKGLAKKEARPRPSKGSKPGSKKLQVRCIPAVTVDFPLSLPCTLSPAC